MFAYGRSPLGPVFRFTRKCSMICCSRDEAERVRNATICRVEPVDLSSVDGIYTLGCIDPDILDVLKHSSKRVEVIILRYD